MIPVTPHPSKPPGEPIAIVGMACRFPQAPDLESFWTLLKEGRTARAEVPPDRWPVDAFFDPDPGAPGKICTRSGAFLEDVGGFDAPFFGVSPREAEAMDPQHRLLLEVAWEAFESAGVPAERLAGTATGCFVGMGGSEYAARVAADPSRINAYYTVGNEASLAANRLSHFFDLRGPSLTIDAGCSSSLVAVHLACQGLRSGEIDMALVGGVNLILSPYRMIGLSQAWLISPDGRCKSFEDGADGYLRGEGCGLIVLRRSAEAVRDGAHVFAVLRGSAVNHAGRGSGLTRPDLAAQGALIDRAIRDAGIAPEQVGFVEAHGVGTTSGDSVELEALRRFRCDATADRPPCFLGSVKANIGHAEWASGIAGLIKAALCVRHGEIPPHPSPGRLAPELASADPPLQLNSGCLPWPAGGGPRLAAVNSFGLGGTGAHAILEEPPAPPARPTSGQRPHLFTLSARSRDALVTLAGRHADYLRRHPDVPLPDVCFSANSGRTQFPHRLAIVAGSTARIREQLEWFADERPTRELIARPTAAERAPRVAFLCPSDWPSAAEACRSLCQSYPAFREAVQRCDQLLHPRAGPQSPAPLPPPPQEVAPDRSAIFKIAYGLAQLWEGWGVPHHVVEGRGVGALAAECISGRLGLAEGLRRAARGGFPDTPAMASQAAPRLGHCDFIVDLGTGSARQPQGPGEDRRPAGDGPSSQPMDHESNLLESLGTLYVHGALVDWGAFYRGQAHQRVVLPTHPFERKRYWIDFDAPGPAARGPSRAAPEARPDPATGLVPRIRAAGPARGLEVLEERLRQEVAEAIGLPSADRVAPSRGFFELGMVSLTALHLRSRLQAALGPDYALPPTAVFDYPTVESLARYILERVLPLADSQADSPEAPPISNGHADRLPSGLQGLSERELEAFLLNKLHSLSERMRP